MIDRTRITDSTVDEVVGCNLEHLAWIDMSNRAIYVGGTQIEHKKMAEDKIKNRYGNITILIY